MSRTERSTDSIFYGAYGGVFVTLGLFLVFWALEIISGITALLLWVMTIGLIVIIAGAASSSTLDKRVRDNKFAYVFGFIMIILSISLLGVLYEIINTLAALGIIIVFVGLGIVIYGISVKS